MSVLTVRNLFKPLAIVAALAFLYASVLRKLGHDWWHDENYSHGLLIPFIIGYILWTERARLRRVATHPSMMWGGALITLSLVALWIGMAGAELFTQRISLLLMLAGVAVYFWGAHILRLLLVPLCLFALAIPIPTIVFNKIAFPLQLFASRCAVWSMRVLDIPVLREGNIIELRSRGSSGTKKLEVAEACSGIRSLMALVTLSVIFAYLTYPRRDDKDGGGGHSPWWKSYGFWRSVLLVVAAVPIAIITNAARVSGTGVLAHYYGTEVADGFFHNFSGWVVYIVAFVMLLSVGWLISRLHRLGKGAGKAATKGKMQAGVSPVSAKGID